MKVDIFDVKIVIPHSSMARTFQVHSVMSSILSNQNIDMLIGRDILGDCLLVYNGVNKIATLAF